MNMAERAGTHTHPPPRPASPRGQGCSQEATTGPSPHAQAVPWSPLIPASPQTQPGPHVLPAPPASRWQRHPHLSAACSGLPAPGSPTAPCATALPQRAPAPACSPQGPPLRAPPAAPPGPASAPSGGLCAPARPHGLYLDREVNDPAGSGERPHSPSLAPCFALLSGLLPCADDSCFLRMRRPCCRHGENGG